MVKLNIINKSKMTNTMVTTSDTAPKHKFTFIEVCAGAGGLSKGFIDNGFHPILLNDTDKYCTQTLKLNHPEDDIFKGSMVDIDLEK